MKKGISIWSFTAGTLEEKFRLAKAAGFDGVEVAMDATGDITPETGFAETETIRKLAKGTGIELYSVASGIYWQHSLTSNDKNEREIAKSCVKKQLQLAAWLGCETILVIPGAVSVSFAPELGVVDYDTAYGRTLEALKELAPEAERLNVHIGLENVWNNFLLSPLEMRHLIDEIGSTHVGSYFDVGNSVANGYPEQWIKILGNRIKKIHFKDYRRSVGSLDGFVDLLAGDVDWKAVISALKNNGYDGWVTGEMIPPYQQYSDQIIFNTSKSMDRILGR